MAFSVFGVYSRSRMPIVFKVRSKAVPFLHWGSVGKWTNLHNKLGLMKLSKGRYIGKCHVRHIIIGLFVVAFVYTCCQLKKSRLLSRYSKSYTTAGLLNCAVLINTLRPRAAENPYFCLHAHPQRDSIICCDCLSFVALASQQLTRPVKPPSPPFRCNAGSSTRMCSRCHFSHGFKSSLSSPSNRSRPNNTRMKTRFHPTLPPLAPPHSVQL